MKEIKQITKCCDCRNGCKVNKKWCLNMWAFDRRLSMVHNWWQDRTHTDVKPCFKIFWQDVYLSFLKNISQLTNHNKLVSLKRNSLFLTSLHYLIRPHTIKTVFSPSMFYLNSDYPYSYSHFNTVLKNELTEN